MGCAMILALKDIWRTVWSKAGIVKVGKQVHASDDLPARQDIWWIKPDWGTCMNTARMAHLERPCDVAWKNTLMCVTNTGLDAMSAESVCGPDNCSVHLILNWKYKLHGGHAHLDTKWKQYTADLLQALSCAFVETVNALERALS